VTDLSGHVWKGRPDALGIVITVPRCLV
jgi:hypothetical protein